MWRMTSLMRYLLHYGVPILLVLGVCLFLYKHKQIPKKWRLIFTLIVIVFIQLLRSFPLENMFMDFDTPDAAFHYATKREILSTIENEKSCIVYYYGSEGITWSVLPKSKKGWKLPVDNALFPQETGISNKSMLPEFCSQCNYTIQRYYDTSDYYLLISAFIYEEDDLEITDNYEANISYIRASDSPLTIICVPFQKFPTDYTLSVNGSVILRIE